MSDRTIAVTDAKGRWVMADLVSEEPPAPAEVSSVEVIGRVVRVHYRSHPTCGTFKWDYARTHRFQPVDKTRRK